MLYYKLDTTDYIIATIYYSISCILYNIYYIH